MSTPHNMRDLLDALKRGEDVLVERSGRDHIQFPHSYMQPFKYLTRINRMAGYISGDDGMKGTGDVNPRVWGISQEWDRYIDQCDKIHMTRRRRKR